MGMSSTLAAHTRARVTMDGGEEEGKLTVRRVRACASEERVPWVEETRRAGSVDEL
jgi:hypothetical protein